MFRVVCFPHLNTSLSFLTTENNLFVIKKKTLELKSDKLVNFHFEGIFKMPPKGFGCGKLFCFF